MFEELAKYNKILVTGPARSGTHICSKMIAADTGHRFIPENRFNAHSVDLFRLMYSINDKFVVPCNGIISHIAEFGHENTMVICMMRTIDDIMLSGWRIKGKLHGMSYMDARRLVLERYKIWEEQEKKGIRNWQYVMYNHLDGHHLWVPKDDRLNFKPTQTKVGEVHPPTVKKPDYSVVGRGRRESVLAQMGTRR